MASFPNRTRSSGPTATAAFPQRWSWPSSRVSGSARIELDAERVGDAALQLVRDLVAAAVCHDLTQLELEIEALLARWASIQVARDLPPAIRRELTVEVEVHLLDRVLAVHRVWPVSPAAIRSSDRTPWVRGAGARGRARRRSPTTATGAAFFLDAADSSRCRWARR